jgi:hypothetical protein
VLSFEAAQRQQSYPEFIEHLEFARAGVLGILPKDEKSASAQAGQPRSYRWLTYATAAVTVALGVSAFELRERFLARHHPTEEPTETPAKKETDEITYDQARQFLAAGDVAKATKAFTFLEARTDTPQPEKNWITLHTALAELLAGHADNASGWFKVIENRGPYSPDLAEQALATFFLDVARRAGGDKPIPVDATKDLDRRNYEALALLIYGLKDWSLGEYDDAWTLFRQYAQITPDSRFTWVGDYKPLVSPFVAEVNVYRPAAEAAKSADNLETRKRALQAVKDARAQIKLATGFAARLDESAQDLQEKITTEEEETARRLAAMEAADTKALTDARTKIANLWQQFRPADAKAVMNAVQVSGEKAQQEREAWLKKLTWLARFKTTLINDLNVVGYASAVPKRAGTQFPGPIRRANDTQIETPTPFGTLSAQWTDLAPDGIIAMAKSFLRPDQAPEQLGERQWLIGVYAYFAGKTKDARDLLTLAAQSAPQHKDELSLFPEGGEAP